MSRYYWVKHYSPKGRFTKHEYVKTPDGCDLKDYLTPPYHIVEETTKEEYDKQPQELQLEATVA